MLVLAALFLAILAPSVQANACPAPQYTVSPSGSGQRVSASSKKVKIKFTIKNTSPVTLDNYVVRMAIPTDKVTYESYNVVGHTAKKKATTFFNQEPDGSVLAWTLYDMPAGNTFKFLVFFQVRDCAALGRVLFPISSYQDVGGFPVCPVLGPTGYLRLVMPKHVKGSPRPRLPPGCTLAPTLAPTSALTTAPTLAITASPTAVCFNKEAQVLLADGAWKEVGDLQKGDRVRTRGMTGEKDDSAHTAALVAVVEMVDSEHTHHDGVCQLAPGFFLTQNHPLRLNGTGQWVRPKWVLPCNRREGFDALYNIIVEEGHHSVHIQGFDVATLVPGPVGEPLLDMPHKFEWYKTLAGSEGFEEGWVRIDMAKLRALRPVDFDSRKFDALQFATVEASGVVGM